MTDSQSEPVSDSTPKSTKKILFSILKWGLFAAVLVFVYFRGKSLLSQSDQSFDLSQIHIGWLALSCAVYIIGWLPGVWFWRQLLFAHKAPVDFKPTLRAYYCGHLGKYIPGKAMALVIRSALLKAYNVPMSTGVLTATYETLASMGTGAAVGLALLPQLLHPFLDSASTSETTLQLKRWAEFTNRPILFPLGVAILTLFMLPIVSALLSKIAVKATPKEMIQDADPPKVSIRLLATGILFFTFGWWMHGLSLGLVLQSVSSEYVSISDWPIWTGTISIATVSGFAALFSPGGLGIREVIITELLNKQPGYDQQQAVIAALLLRIVWFIGEVVFAGFVFWFIAKKHNPLDNTTPATSHSQ